MQNRIKLDYVGCENLYSQAVSPEGERYDYRAGCMVRAITTGSDDHGGYSDYWIYVGPNGDTTGNGGVECFNDDDAVKFVNRVKDYGSINPACWFNCERSYHNDLPDYAVNPHRPEYN
jgi:hypothetical protein